MSYGILGGAGGGEIEGLGAKVVDIQGGSFERTVAGQALVLAGALRQPGVTRQWAEVKIAAFLQELQRARMQYPPSFHAGAMTTFR